jgi:hypothetical protein
MRVTDPADDPFSRPQLLLLLALRALLVMFPYTCAWRPDGGHSMSFPLHQSLPASSLDVSESLPYQRECTPHDRGACVAPFLGRVPHLHCGTDLMSRRGQLCFVLCGRGARMDCQDVMPSCKLRRRGCERRVRCCKTETDGQSPQCAHQQYITYMQLGRHRDVCTVAQPGHRKACGRGARCPPGQSTGAAAAPAPPADVAYGPGSSRAGGRDLPPRRGRAVAAGHFPATAPMQTVRRCARADGAAKQPTQQPYRPSN